MFLLTAVWNPLPSELGDWGPADLASMGDPRLFSTKEAAFAFVEAAMAEDDARNSDTPEDERNRLLDESEAGGSSTWVYGAADTDPNDEDADYSCFVFWYCSPIAIVA